MSTAQITNENPVSRLIYTILCVCTAIIGYRIHGSIFWSIIDFIFMPIAWIKWLICQEVNITLINRNLLVF